MPNFGPTPNPDIRTALITGLYAAILGRAPEPAGLAAGVAALQAGASVEQIAVGLFGSAEYRQLAQATVVGDSQAMLAAINQARAGSGNLPPMADHPLLQAMAQSHADVMAAKNIESHNDAGDGTFLARLIASKYPTIGGDDEIIATGRSVPEAMALWMGETGAAPHKMAILGPCTQAGCASATGGDGTVYYCCVFGMPT